MSKTATAICWISCAIASFIGTVTSPNYKVGAPISFLLILSILILVGALTHTPFKSPKIFVGVIFNAAGVLFALLVLGY